jgi:5,5'-dehydrodivanillate O-demethylase
LLTSEENELLCRVGRGTPMGELMRRYWQPVAATSELSDEQPVKALRILGEDLALYHDLQDRLGLIGLYCPHRLRPLTYGIPEEEGLRCPYTGWLFDAEGRCLDIPFEPEDSTLKYEVRATAYPAQELGGLIWAYLGPLPAPLLPRWDVLVWDNVFRQIGHTVLPCNWLQCMESAVDPADNPYLRGQYFRDAQERASRLAPGPETNGHGLEAPRLRSAFERFKFGIVERLGRPAGSGEIEEWVEGHPLVFPAMVRLGSGFRQELQVRVPIDDTHTWNLRYQCYLPADGVAVETQESVPLYEIPLKDDKGEYIFSIPGIRDMVLWSSQGELLDRTRENLGPSDDGLLLYRRVLQQQVSIVEDGGEPMNVFRHAADMGPSVELQPRYAPLPAPGGFDPERLEDDVEQYSPAVSQITELYRKSFPNAEPAAPASRPRRRPAPKPGT